MTSETRGMLMTTRIRRSIRRHRKKLVAIGILLLLPFALHVAIGATTTIPLPSDPTPRYERRSDGPVARAGRGVAVTRGVRIVRLAGSPAEIGAAHTALLHDRMITDERVLWDGFERVLPSRVVRALIFDVARVQHRSVAENFPPARRLELTAEARAFDPDPYASRLPTYQRMVMLHALYDVALGFEHSPLLGCTAFGLGPETTTSGHVLFGRAFDFEAAAVFDRDKTVFVVHEDGKIPFASVAWPGFVGVVTGMNAEGVAVAVHGGRARETSTSGVPVAFSLREALAGARTTDEAVAILTAQDVMVSHIVFVADSAGRFAVVERAPKTKPHVRTSFARPGTASVTNHFEGELASDPKNVDVERTTTTLARRTRIDELLGQIAPKSMTVEKAVAILRDHTCAKGEACPLGDRRAIDAFIATHGVVADLTARALWVSEGPRLSGRFVKIDPAWLVHSGGCSNTAPCQDLPDMTAELEAIGADPALEDGRYSEGRARAGGPLLGDEAAPPRIKPE